MKFKKGDEVLVTAGKDRGKKGKIEKVLLKKNAAMVTGVNIYKKHLKPRAQDKPGGIIDLGKPMDVAKIALICPKCGRQTRVGFKERTRICRKCQGVI